MVKRIGHHSLAALLSALPLLAEVATPPAIEEGAGIVATVNGEPIFFEDLERRLADMHAGQSATQRGAFDVDQLMFRMVNDTLLAQEARVLGMHREDPIPERLANLRRNLAVDRLEREEIGALAEPTDDEVRAAFEKNYQTATLRILTSYERDESERLAAELRAGADFEQLVEEHSVDQYSARGGLLNNLDRADIPVEIAEVAFSSEPGTLAGPIRTGLGWANIRVESVEPADPERFPSLERHIRQVVRLGKADELRAALGARLRELHPTRVDWEAVRSIEVEQLRDGRLMPEVPDPETVVARVGERQITAGRLARALQLRWAGVRNREAAEAARPLVLERLLQEQLMVAEAERRGYDETPEVQRRARALETQLLIPRYLSEVVGAGVEVTDEEVRAYYEDHLDTYRRRPRVHYRQMTVATLEEAERLVELLRDGADFGWLARRHSTDGFKEAGGDRGWLEPNPGADEMQQDLYEAQPGDVLGPRGVPGNFMILQVDAREEQGTYAFEEVASHARSAAYSIKFSAVLDEFITKLRERSEIVVNEDVLASMRIGGRVLEEEEDASHAH